jgi:hypothetical protein
MLINRSIKGRMLGWSHVDSIDQVIKELLSQYWRESIDLDWVNKGLNIPLNGPWLGATSLIYDLVPTTKSIKGGPTPNDAINIMIKRTPSISCINRERHTGGWRATSATGISPVAFICPGVAEGRSRSTGGCQARYWRQSST